MIYFIRSGRRRVVKIGHSAGHPRARLLTLQTGSAEPLQLVGMLDGSQKEEAEWHRRFSHLRLSGEWFEWRGELARAMRPHLFETKVRRLQRSIDQSAALAAENGWPFDPAGIVSKLERRLNG